MGKKDNKKNHLPLYGIGPALCFSMALVTVVCIWLANKGYIFNITYNGDNNFVGVTSRDYVLTIKNKGNASITVPTSIIEGNKLVITVVCTNISGNVNVTVDSVITQYGVSCGMCSGE